MPRNRRPATSGDADAVVYDAIIVGAGPAGCAAAATLAALGRRVLLVEKEVFPRHKVCGAFLSPAALPLLQQLGALDAVRALGPETICQGEIHTGRGCLDFRLPSPALGISRFALDDLLARRAREAGAQVLFGARVTSVERAGALFRVALAGDGTHTLRARAAIGAWGRWDAIDRSLGRRFLRGERFLGWSCGYRKDASLAGCVRLYLFPGGYCGLSRVEAGAVNLAGVISAKAREAAGGRWEAVIEHARRQNPDLDADLAELSPDGRGIIGTGPVFFTAKPPVEDGVLMAGDAAGVLDPFSGQGQTAALAGGVLVGKTIEAAAAGEIAWRDLPGAYADSWTNTFRRRFGWSAVFRLLMLRPRLASLAVGLAGHSLFRLGVEKLQRVNFPERRRTSASGKSEDAESRPYAPYS